MEEKVLIVGAGPTGLVLALWLTKFGIPVRIIDKNSGPGQTSRAMVIHARTLEFYQQINLAEKILAQGIIVDHITVRKNGKITATIALGPLGQNESPFPFVFSLPQDDHEKILIEELTKAGISIERNTELISLTQTNNHVSAVIRKDDQTEKIITPFVLGCDGAHSTVRSQLDILFPGGTYSKLFYVADVVASGEVVNNQLQLCLSTNDFTLAFPIRSSGSIRLIGIVPREKEKNQQLQFTDVAEAAVRDTKISIAKINWFSTYHSHHRVAKQFEKGRIFLLGDAAHIHSPVGGQGMNTGIGDAINLAWKIAAVLKHRAAESILASFEVERMQFAKRLVRTTDKIFQAVINRGISGYFIRNIFFPFIFPVLIHVKWIKHFLFNTVSQIKINYRHSFLSEGAVDAIKSGDRLPWVKECDNFKSLQLLDWQIHIYGQASLEFKNAMQVLGLTLQQYPWNDVMSKKGLIKDAIYLIRPDGYIAFAHRYQKIGLIENYLSEHSIVITQTHKK